MSRPEQPELEGTSGLSEFLTRIKTLDDLKVEMAKGGPITPEEQAMIDRMNEPVTTEELAAVDTERAARVAKRTMQKLRDAGLVDKNPSDG